MAQITRERIGMGIGVFALGCSLLHLYSPLFGIWEGLRLVSLSVYLVLTILVHSPLWRADIQASRPRVALVALYDLALIAGVAATTAYIFQDYDGFFARSGLPTETDIVFGVIYLSVILEATRRSLGWALVVLCIVFLAFALEGQSLPRLFAHAGASFQDAVEFAFRDESGILGLPLGIMASYVVLFVYLGSIMERAGAGDFLLEISKRIAGRGAAGPAKIAVVSSALFGTVSGSAVANVVTTGAFTIPLMKRTGVPGHHAGAIEAVASTGGILMPPIMGAAAFIAAQNAGLPYIHFAVAAAIPAIYYFTAVFLFVEFEGRKRGLKAADVPSREGLNLWREAAWILPPFALLIYMLVQGYSPGRGAGVAMVVLAAGILWRHGLREGARHVVLGLVDGSKAAAPLIVAAAAAGFVIGMVYLTGIGLRFTTIIVELAGGNLLLCLLYVALATLVLGMGLPITAAYLTAATLSVPALKALGVSDLAGHMFVFYYAAISAITPPVALASYAAAGVAGASFWTTSVQACRYGIIGFVVPFVFVYREALLILNSDPVSVAYAAMTGLAGIFALAVAVIGFMRGPVPVLWRLLLLCCSVAFTVLPFPMLDAASAALLGLFLLLHLRAPRMRTAM